MQTRIPSTLPPPQHGAYRATWHVIEDTIVSKKLKFLNKWIYAEGFDISGNLAVEINEWCKENIIYGWSIDLSAISSNLYIVNKDEVLMFKLRWME